MAYESESDHSNNNDEGDKFDFEDNDNDNDDDDDNFASRTAKAGGGPNNDNDCSSLSSPSSSDNEEEYNDDNNNNDDACEESIEQTYQKKTNRIVQREVTYTPGFYKMNDKIVVNAADNKQRHPVSNRLVLFDSNDDVDNLKMKKRFTIAESDDDNKDDNPCYDVVEFDKTCRKLRLIGYDETKATEITRGIYFPKLTDIAVSHTTSQAINVTNPCYDVVEFDKTRRKLRLIGYDKTKATEIMIGIYNCPKLTDIAVSHTRPSHQHHRELAVHGGREDSVFRRRCLSRASHYCAASAAYSATVATAMEESSEDGDIYSLLALIVGGECSGQLHREMRTLCKQCSSGKLAETRYKCSDGHRHCSNACMDRHGCVKSNETKAKQVS